MNDMIRLAFRIVVLSSSLNDEELYQRVLALFSQLGKLYDFRNNPYPKINGAHMWLIEFDIARSLDGGIDKLLELVGGTGWHRSEQTPSGRVVVVEPVVLLVLHDSALSVGGELKFLGASLNVGLTCALSAES